MKRKLAIFLVAVLALGILAGCGRNNAYRKGQQAPEPAPEAAAFRVGLVPGVEALPLWIAEQGGYFTQELLTVELVNFETAQERNDALAAGTIDGMLSDLVDGVATIGAGAKARVVAMTMAAGDRPVSLLAGRGAGITAAAELSGEEITIPPGLAMRYAAERLLADQNLTGVTLVEGDGPAALVEALAAGDVTAAILPEPYASMAAGRAVPVLVAGAENRAGDMLSTLVFTEDAIKTKGAAITRFFRSYNLGVADLRIKHDPRMELLTEKTGLPITIKVVYDRAFPVSLTAIPKRDDVERAGQWLVGKQLLQSQPAFEQVVDTTMLPAAAQ